ncbi:MAG: sulfite exporter TauE/SafE family protein [Nostoc sp. ChiSLP02]|nr:sulfite exporter TauE/SafE family protein [Nostoc sp. DedSLP05]MDZ8103837.1 sulfite exporter TauE/SafE family protein [Nostoc sp. DedSLP01]MDZ8184413.1 sulfite exporter TauE/SafE family protein [Nostoc sp. ChiSLP02]
MSGIQLILLVAIFFITSVISVITGSTSLITVPVMLQFSIEPRTALATNMLALTFMSVGGTLPFIGKKIIDYNRLPIIIFLTVVGSIIGALLVLVIPSDSMPAIISVLMIVVAIFSIFNRDAGIISTKKQPSIIIEICGYLATFLLGVYGGFFSGGYVTMLTVVYVSLFRMTFVQAVANTKFINIFSSLIATIIFFTQGIVDYKLGIILSITMFLGGIVGSQIAFKLNNIGLRRIFITTVIALAIKTLFDFLT